MLVYIHGNEYSLDLDCWWKKLFVTKQIMLHLVLLQFYQLIRRAAGQRGKIFVFKIISNKLLYFRVSLQKWHYLHSNRQSKVEKEGSLLPGCSLLYSLLLTYCSVHG